jgi:succinate dehydrogenase/fumarate reductase flavoprotein subunit
MKTSKPSKRNILRRDFMKTTAVCVGATAVAGFSATETKTAGVPRKWDKEADVIVVGCGGAGTTAAITAHDAGAKVLVLEKAPEGGGNSRVGGGQFSFSTVEKKDNAAAYLYAACNGTTPKDVCQAWADEMVHNGEWLEKMGVSARLPNALSGADFRGFPGSDGIGTGMMNALAWYKAIEKQIASRGIEVLFNSPAIELVQNPITKEILGVKANSGGGDKLFKARKGVILCTGGFEFNEDMKKNYLRPTTIKFTGWIYNTGDGIKMAQAVGADLWHMNMICSALYTIVTPQSQMGYMYPEPKGSNFILVTKYGQRFMKEGEWFPHRSVMGYSLWDWRSDRKDSEYPCSPHYMIFDETTRLAGGIGAGMAGMGNTVTPTRLGGYAPDWGVAGGEWSKDNSAEIEKGWIKKANTIEALAEMIGGEMTSAALTASVARWNGFCEAGVDSDFGRTNSRGMRPRNLEKIQTPPFYAVEIWPGGFSTCGGPRKNAKGQVLGADGQPIKRLYEAGSLGHTCGQVYSMSGANYCECFVWGRISGRNAAAMDPWS